jgi:LmbE family N-acetylglucosaminyl deacetylase
MLVLAPHTDDAEIGCGGAIARRMEEGWEVTVAAFSRAEDSLPRGAAPDMLEGEMRASLATLGLEGERVRVLAYAVRRFGERRQDILDDMIRLRGELNPDLVLAPCGQDTHQDHEVIHKEAMRAFRGCSFWGYELPWNQVESVITGYVALEERHIAAKVRALACYASQVELTRP